MRKFLLIFAGISLSIGLATTDSLDYNKWVIKIQNVEQPSTEVSNIDISSQVRDFIRQITFDGDFTVGEYLAMNPRVSRRFERNPILARPVDTKFLSDGSVSAEYEVAITGTLLKTLMPQTGGGIPLAPLCCPTCKRPGLRTSRFPKV